MLAATEGDPAEAIRLLGVFGTWLEARQEFDKAMMAPGFDIHPRDAAFEKLMNAGVLIHKEFKQ